MTPDGGPRQSARGRRGLGRWFESMAQPGGAVLTPPLARLWNVGTGCVSVRGDDYPADMLDRLQGCGVDLLACNRPSSRSMNVALV